MASLKEKIGYGFGDMSSSMFWKIFSAYLPIFYATVFHLSLEVTGVLMLVTRIWDAVSDPMMGIIADRTNTRWGKYRPYLLWMSIPFAIAGVMLFTKPEFGEPGNTVWAFFTYILMMTVYTGINVPYGSMLGVMTEDSDEKTVFSSFRMFFAYAGSFIVLAMWEPLCNFFANMIGTLKDGETLTRDPQAWQYAMIVVGVTCFALFVLTFLMTRENVKTVEKTTSVKDDLGSLLHNGPWWILLGGVLFFNFCYYNTITTSGMAIAAVLLYTSPIFVMLMSLILFRERMTVRKVTSLLLTVVGCVLVSGIFTAGGTFTAGGLALGIGAGFGYALYSIFSRFALQRGYHPMTITFYTFLLSAVGGVLFTDFEQIATSSAAFGWSLWLPMLAYVVLGTVGAYLLYTAGLKHIDNSKASVMAAVEPACATLLQIVVLGVMPDVYTMVGIILVLGAIVWLNLGKENT